MFIVMYLRIKMTIQIGVFWRVKMLCNNYARTTGITQDSKSRTKGHDSRLFPEVIAAISFPFAV